MTFPAINPLMQSYQEMVPDTALRSAMDQGPAKVRQRTTAGVRNITAVYLLTNAQISTLETYYLTTQAGGALSFSWTHPRTGSTVTARFKAPPSYSPASGTFYYVTLSLEILP